MGRRKGRRKRNKCLFEGKTTWRIITNPDAAVATELDMKVTRYPARPAPRGKPRKRTTPFWRDE
jgi:hypothetical protein